MYGFTVKSLKFVEMKQQISVTDNKLITAVTEIVLE